MTEPANPDPAPEAAAGSGSASTWSRPAVDELSIAEVMAYIRARCPWASAHTHASLEHFLREETHELLEALDDYTDAPRPDTAGDLVGELGDVLYQVLFHSALLDESGLLDAVAPSGAAGLPAPSARGLGDPLPPRAWDLVLARLKAKLVRRHPHVFDSTGPVDIDTVEARYEAIKQAERAARAETPAPTVDAREDVPVDPVTASLASVPTSLPALSRARAVVHRLARLQARERDAPGEVTAAESPTGAPLTEEALGAPLTEEALGEALYALVARADAAGIDAESALHAHLSRPVRR